MPHFAARPATVVVAGLALVLALPVPRALAQASRTTATARLKHTVMSNGHPLTLWEKRAAQPTRAIVLLHGRTWSSVPDFDLQVAGEQRSLMDALVAKGYAVYALDLRGYGATPRDKSGWNSPKVAADDLGAALEWVMTNSGLPGKPVLFGWSNGATIAHLSAQKYPERISDLILFGYWKDPDLEIPAVPDTITPLRERTTAEAAASDFIAPNAISKKAVRAYVAAALAADPVRTDWRRLEEYNALYPARVRVPTLLLQGELDPMLPSEALGRFFSRLGTPDRQWVVIAGGDHAALLEDMQPAFVAAMVGFIERPRRKG
ncbi:MAG: alpha/beta hydrolase [Gemmatimonadales bacterium]